ncbi:siderophore-interacting protein [Gymnodinialimonas sp. 2305UL16-5]|uniref:siderophore-interacting protein n=1 Tax=Gymnodinialimonas mytili TaxID=3126503 RepID=UPI003097A7E0
MTKHHIYTDLSGLTFDVMQAFLIHEARAHELDVVHNTVNRISVETLLGVIDLRVLGNAHLRLKIGAQSLGDMHILRDSVVSHIVEVFPATAQTIRWSDAPQQGEYPPKFQFATVLGRRDVSVDFVRVILRLDRSESFTDKAIHFRFVLPNPDDPAPIWPAMRENGTTLWPQDDKALHVPVYTIRTQRQDEVEVDIFRHMGGRTLAWAEAAAIGDRVAIMGPGGSGVLDRNRVILAGDATAFPAIARLLDALPTHAKGHVFLRAPGRARDYPIHPGAQINLTWLDPDDPDALPERTARALRAAPDHFLWFAASKPEVAAFRALIADLDIDKSNKYVAQFWSPEASS